MKVYVVTAGDADANVEEKLVLGVFDDEGIAKHWCKYNYKATTIYACDIESDIVREPNVESVWWHPGEY